MPKLASGLRKELRAFAASRMDLVAFYEGKGQFETAYLARWAVLEKFVKAVVAEYRRDQLKASLFEWLQYVRRKQPRKPARSPETTLEVRHLPERTEFVRALNYYEFDGRRLWSVMGATAKPRGFRNQIAHTGRRFTKELQYRKLSKLLNDVTAKTLGR